MVLFKSKSMAQKVEERQAKLQMKAIALEDIRMNAAIRGEKEKMASAEMRRLRA